MVLLGSVALAWTEHIDTAAHEATSTNFKRALAVAGLARALNGVISVAQGTELAVQPVGIGVTLTIGEILDPLNDLVERFSWLALFASVSLGLQLAVSEMVASAWASAAATAAVLALLVMLWMKPGHAWLPAIARVALIALAARFLLALVLLANHWIDATFLAERQDAAVAQLTHTSSSLESWQERNQAAHIGATEEHDGILDRAAAQLGALLDSSAAALDLRGHLDQLQALVESSVTEIVNLIVVFLLQTLLLPVLVLWLGWRGLLLLIKQLFPHQPPP